MREVTAQAGLTVRVAGTPEKGRQVAVLWGDDVTDTDDLRASIAGATDIELVLIADPADFGEDSADAAAVEGFIRRGGRVMTLEPLPSTVHAFSAGWGVNMEGASLSASIGFAGSARTTPAIRDALETLAQFGAVTAFAVNCSAGSEAGSLGARLLSAMELVYLIAGEPESMSASLAHPREVRTNVGDRLHHLRGTMTANIRFSDARAATLLVSASSEPWHRGMTILGEGGRMRVWDDGFVWTAPDGSVVDEHRLDTRSAVRPAARHIAAAILETLNAPPPRVFMTTILAMAETALLSARTGSPESPDTLLRVAESR